MKQNALKNSLHKHKPLVPEDDLPEKIPLTSTKNFHEAETKLEQIYPKLNPQPPVVIAPDMVKLTVQIPNHMMRAIKLKCVQEGITIKQYVIRLLEGELN